MNLESKENILNSILYNTNTVTNIKKYNNCLYKLDEIVSGFNLSNQLTNINFRLTKLELDTIKKLVDLGVQFDMKNSPDKKILITDYDLVFPICCVGKNRSQYLFYYFENLLRTNPNKFILGYPASGDELSTIIKSKSNSVLGGFTIQYKSDGFSLAIKSSFGTEYSRSIHVFDKLIRREEAYLPSELKNLEEFKYKNTKFDIYGFESNQVEELYLNYYLNPKKLNELLNGSYRINYVCASPESFVNLCEVLVYTSELNSSIDWSNIRIIYFGFNDIFQRSSVSNLELQNLQNLISSTFIIQ